MQQKNNSPLLHDICYMMHAAYLSPDNGNLYVFVLISSVSSAGAIASPPVKLDSKLAAADLNSLNISVKEANGLGACFSSACARASEFSSIWPGLFRVYSRFSKELNHTIATKEMEVNTQRANINCLIG